MLIKTVLNRLEHFKSFVFGTVTFQVVNGSEALIIEIKARANSNPECPECAYSDESDRLNWCDGDRRSAVKPTGCPMIATDWL